MIIEPHQYTLGELIEALRAEDPAKPVPLGFTHPHSWRGVYHDLAFEVAENTTVGAMLAAAESALGTTYEGWKGGEYRMNEMTDCWLAVEGHGDGEVLGRITLAYMLGKVA